MKKTITYSILILLFIFPMTGCYYSITAQGVRDKTIKAHTFYIDKNYQQAYREVFTKTQESVGRSQKVEGSLFTDIKQGVITVSEPYDVLLASNAGIYFAIDINMITENKTEVKSYTSTWMGKRWVEKVEKWMNPNREKIK